MSLTNIQIIMQNIDMKGIIEKSGLKKRVFAENLFPDNKFPMVALDRVIRGVALLDSDQISRLALLLGVGPSSLFTGENWCAKTKNGTHTITNGEYVAELNIRTSVTKLYHKNSIFHEEVLHSRVVTLSSYLIKLDSIIYEYEQQKSKK